MNRAGLCIKMLNLLKARGKMNTAQLAQALETNPRNIRELKKELIIAGYNIQDVRGRYGGYYLMDQVVPVRKLKVDEIQALKEARLFLNSQPEFCYSEDFNTALDLIISSYENTESSESLYLPQAYIPLDENEKEFIDCAQKAISDNRMLEISYQSVKEEIPFTFEVDPYTILHWNQAYYLIAYSHRRNAYRTFRFSKQRMKSCRLTEHPFVRDLDFDVKSMIGEQTIFHGKLKEYTVRVQVEKDRRFKECFWGSDLKQIRQDSESYDYSFFNESDYMVCNQIFSFGEGIQLLAPKECVNDYVEKLETQLKRYEVKQD